MKNKVIVNMKKHASLKGKHARRSGKNVKYEACRISGKGKGLIEPKDRKYEMAKPYCSLELWIGFILIKLFVFLLILLIISIKVFIL